MSKQYYVDAANGSDSNTGLSADSPLKSFAKLDALVGAGDTVNLKSGSTWHDDLWITSANVTVQSYGSGPNPIIHGDNGARAGIIVTADNALIRGIDVMSASNGVYITGTGAAATVLGGSFTANGTGIVVGNGGQLVLADGVTCSGSLRSLGAGDGIQISADAGVGPHTIVNATCIDNAFAGLNAKAGTVTISDSTLSFNGEPGWIAQNNLAVLNVVRSHIEGNNRSDNGTGQASIEDAAIVNSIGNTYVDPHNGAHPTVQINMIASNGALHSSGDHFVNGTSQTNTVGSIRVNTGANPATVTVTNAVFDHAAKSGIAVDAYGATALDLTLTSSTFNMTDTRAVRVTGDADFTSALVSNHFTRADHGVVIEVQDTDYYRAGDIASLLAKYAPVPELPVETTPVLPPMILSLSAHGVDENRQGAVIGNVTVGDAALLGPITYTVSDSRFEVVAGSTCALKLAPGMALDFEAEPCIVLSITAEDGAGASVTRSFTIDVRDIAGVTLAGTSANDTIGEGTGRLTATAEADTIDGKGGNDRINGLGGNDVLLGGAGNDIIAGDDGDDRLSGDSGDDMLAGGAGDDRLEGGVGRDVLAGDSGDDWLDGGAGDDFLQGGAGNDTLVTTKSESVRDIFDGGEGIDRIIVSGADPVTLAGFNAETASIEGWVGNGQALLGTSSADTFDFRAVTSLSGLAYIDAGNGNDRLHGSRFADDLRGGNGADMIEGGAGNDVLTGGAGSDTFLFARGFGQDVITDFKAVKPDADSIQFEKGVFANYAAVIAASKQVGADVVITASEGSSLVLSKVAMAQLSPDDFRFV